MRAGVIEGQVSFIDRDDFECFGGVGLAGFFEIAHELHARIEMEGALQLGGPLTLPEQIFPGGPVPDDIAHKSKIIG